MYEIIEKSNGTSFRVYETLQQAESFCKKFPGYLFRKVETKEEVINKQEPMNNEETQNAPEAPLALPPHVEQPVQEQPVAQEQAPQPEANIQAPVQE